MWIEFPLDKGAVNSRTPSQLAPGEFQQASNVRYKPGSKQLHNDLNWKPWETTLNLVEPFATKWFGPFYLNFEGKNDWLMLVANVSGFVETGPRARIYFAREEESGTWERSSYVLADNVGNQVGITAASITHWGDRYYLATDQGCVEIAPSTGTGIPTVNQLGMHVPEGEVYAFNSHFVRGYPRFPNMLLPGASWATAFIGADSGSVSWAGGGSDSTLAIGDLVTLYITEVDIDAGVESQPIYTTYRNVQATGEYPTINFPAAYVNDRASGFRVYLKYEGTKDIEASVLSSWQARRTYREAVIGAGILEYGVAGSTESRTEFEPGETAIVFDRIDKESTTAPLPVLGVDSARVLYSAFRPPNTASVAAVWNDSLVLNDTGFNVGSDFEDTDPSGNKYPGNHDKRREGPIPTIVRYSPPGDPNNQLVPYFMNFASEREDAIKGLLVVNDRLLVLCDQACHTVRYLPFNNLLASQQGRVKDVLTTNVGLVSPKASAKIETMRGEMAVWLSHRGLEWTDGTMWDDACRDFKIPEGVDASEALLVNMSSEYRLDLYLGTNLYSFYYHPDHLKDGRLKMLGPTDIGYIVTGACEYKGNAYRFDGFQLYQKDSENKGGYGYVLTGQVRGANPFKDLVAEDLALTHSASDADFSCRADGAVTGNEASIGNTVLLQNPQLEETGSSGTSQRGNYLRFWFGANGFDDDWAIGPAWLNLDQESGGLG